MRKSSLLWASPAVAVWLTAAISIILFTASVAITNAQQLPTSQSVAIQKGTLFQSTEDSFRVLMPDGWVIQDVNNKGSKLIEESTQGYGILAQLCPQEQQQQGLLNASADISSSCQGSNEDIIHIIRYPNLDTRLQLAYGVTANNFTTDNILSYHLQKLQEVGYRSIQIVNSTERAVNVTNAQTNQTIEMVPAKLVEMTYITNFAPNETRKGHFILTATNATTPNPGMTKGYSIFYENASVPAAVQTTPVSASLPASIPLPAPIRQVFDSFQLIAAPAGVVGGQSAAQTGQQSAAQTGQTDCDSSYPDDCIPPPPPDLDCGDEGVPENFEVRSPDPHGFDGNDNDGIGCESGSNQSNQEQTNGGDGGGNATEDNNGEGTASEDMRVQGRAASGVNDDYDETADEEQTNGDCDGC
jgi:hypothetical protein